MSVDDKRATMRRLLWTPCETKEDLARWIRVFLEFDLPDTTIDEQSTSNPMDLVWEIYSNAQKKSPDFSRILGYACREGIKTLSAAILEVLAILHLGRPSAHMAAVESQSQKAIGYVKRFFSRPHLRDFVVGDNKRQVIVVKFEDDQGNILSEKEWNKLPWEEQSKYEKQSFELLLIIATMQGTNSWHGPYFTLDEIDLAPPKPYEEAKMMPSPMLGKLPITFLTSTRKFAFGLVQHEIDKAEKSGLEVRHWNIIDVTEKCPPERHLPNEPKQLYYVDRESFRTLAEDEYDLLPEESRKAYSPAEGFTGCRRNCPLFAMCRGRLATAQRPHFPKGISLLKPIEHVINQFKHVSLEAAKAQLMCWKPSETGLIYPRLTDEVHLKTAAEMATLLTGEDYPEDFSKEDLIALLRKREAVWAAGMDFGYTHCFAVTVSAVDGNRMFVVDGFSIPQLELPQKLDVCDERLKPYDATIYPDMADPSSIKTFKRNGYRMKAWNKAKIWRSGNKAENKAGVKGTVIGGIEIVRMKLNPAIGQPEIFFLRGDEGVWSIYDNLRKYHWKTDSTGKVTNIPDDDDDDAADAFRYMVMNTFAPKGRVTVPRRRSATEEPIDVAVQRKKQYTQEGWMQKVIEEQTGVAADPIASVSNTGPAKGRKGSFVWDM